MESRRGFLKALGTGIVGAVVAPLGDARVGWRRPLMPRGLDPQAMQDMLALYNLRREYIDKLVPSYKIGYDPASGVEYWKEASDIIVPVTATEVAIMQQEALTRTTHELFEIRAAIAGSFVSKRRLLPDQIQRAAGLAPGDVLPRRDERGHGLLELPDGDVS